MQPGMAAEARGTVDPDDAVVSSFVEMRARYLVDTGRWQDEVTDGRWTWERRSCRNQRRIRHGVLLPLNAANLPTARNALATLLDLLPRLRCFDAPARRQPIRCAGPADSEAALQAVILSLRATETRR